MNKSAHIMKRLCKIGNGRQSLAAFVALAAAALALPASAVNITKNTTLTADTTYTSVVTFQGNYTLNLNGHVATIKCSGNYAFTSSRDTYTGTITDSAGGGELRIEVASGMTQTPRRCSITGKVKFVKAGSGTLVLSLDKTIDYTGGTEVQEGTLKINTAAANVFGAGGQTVSVGESGTIDLGGNGANLANYTIAMVEGAKIINSGADTTAAVKVSGTFSPVATAGGFTVAPQNGTTIDFSRWNAAFPIVSPAFRFATNGTYPLNLKPTATMAELGKSRDGDSAYNGYLISWSAAPSGVAFQKQEGLGDQFRIKSKAKGLLLEYVSGLGVILK